jgi:hypothetical protein
MAVQLRARRAGPIGHHRKQSALHGEVEATHPRGLVDHLGDAEPLSQRLEHIEIPIGPGVHELPLRILRHDLLGGDAFEDAGGK